MRDKKVSKDRLFKILSRISDQKQKNKERIETLIFVSLACMLVVISGILVSF